MRVCGEGMFCSKHMINRERVSGVKQVLVASVKGLLSPRHGAT